MKTLGSLIKGLFFLIVIAVLIGGFYFYNQYTNYLQQPIQLNEENASYEVKKGSSIRRVAQELDTQGVMKPAIFFIALAKINKQTSKLKAGEYKLTADMKPTDVLNLITSGKAIQYKHTIIEGKTYKQLVTSIKASTVLQHTLSDEDFANILSLIGSDFGHPEGAFYADTYNFPKNTTDLDFLKRSHKMMREKLKEAWISRAPEASITTPYEALILASIVEKETGNEEERPMIARVFINRLDKGMLLQTDPTVIYGMGEAYDGNIRRKDLTRDTPYNTYTREGLTPTPIATPGRAALNAVMHPPEGDVFYFVARGDGSGKSYFTKTNAEHNRAVKKYLRNQRQQR